MHETLNSGRNMKSIICNFGLKMNIREDFKKQDEVF